MTQKQLDLPGTARYLARKQHFLATKPAIPDGETIDSVLGSDKYDSYYGIKLARLHRVRLSPAAARAYDVLKLPESYDVYLTGEARDKYIRYLLRIGGKAVYTEYDSLEDGLNHINVYSKSRCLVGRMCSNFYEKPDDSYFQTLHGVFKTLEGYYHWLRLLDYAIACKSSITADDRDDIVRMKEHAKSRRLDYDVLRHLDGRQCILKGRELKATVYGETRYRPGSFSKKAEAYFRYAMTLKLTELTVDGIPLAVVLSDYIYSGIPLRHYYVMGGKVVEPPHSEWLPSVIVWVCEHFDPNASDIQQQKNALLKEIAQLCQYSMN